MNDYKAKTFFSIAIACFLCLAGCSSANTNVKETPGEPKPGSAQEEISEAYICSEFSLQVVESENKEPVFLVRKYFSELKCFLSQYFQCSQGHAIGGVEKVPYDGKELSLDFRTGIELVSLEKISYQYEEAYLEPIIKDGKEVGFKRSYKPVKGQRYKALLKMIDNGKHILLYQPIK